MQHFLFLISLLSAASFAAAQDTNVTTGALGDAQPVYTNPEIGETWVATFESAALNGTVRAVAAEVGVNYTIDVTGLAEDKGPYKYHVHVYPVPAENGTCADTGGHLDPYKRTDTPPCESSLPQTCEVGDMSGKYGVLVGGDVKKEFNDPYSALNETAVGYIGGRSIVFHDGSGARIACATLVKVEASESDSENDCE